MIFVPDTVHGFHTVPIFTEYEYAYLRLNHAEEHGSYECSDLGVAGDCFTLRMRQMSDLPGDVMPVRISVDHSFGHLAKEAMKVLAREAIRTSAEYVGRSVPRRSACTCSLTSTARKTSRRTAPLCAIPGMRNREFVIRGSFLGDG